MANPNATPAEREVLEAISVMSDEKGFPPTQRELAVRVNKSPSMVRIYIRSLARKGYLSINPGKPRAITVIPYRVEQQTA